MYDAYGRGGGVGVKPQSQFPNAHGPKPHDSFTSYQNAHGAIQPGSKPPPSPTKPNKPNRPFRPGKYLTPEQIFALQQMRSQVSEMRRARGQSFQLGRTDLLNSRTSANEDLSRAYTDGREALPGAFTGRGIITSGLAQQALTDMDLRRAQNQTRIDEQFDNGMFDLKMQRQQNNEAILAMQNQIRQQIQAWITANESQVSGGV